MAVSESDARGWAFDLNTGTAATPVWVAVGGITTWSHKLSSGKADTTDMDDAGATTHRKMSRTHEWTLKGNYLEDVDTGDRDAGQEAVESWAVEVGADSVKQFRITTPAGTTRTFDATADVNWPGGGNDDQTGWECTLEQSGAATIA